jgi:2-polyprenyl-3-methyl-5-hydroxy-6-metoxy-1,4-benzoquinol methylase
VTHPTEQRALSYRERVYASYVSAFKGRVAPDEAREEYERHARYLDSLLRPVVERAPTSILEVGCGPGNFLYWATTRGVGDVHGIDLSSEQVDVARSFGLPAEVASFDEWLPGRAGQFDCVVALDVVEHLTRDEAFRFLDLSFRALRPGGHIFLTTPNGAALRPGPLWFGDLTHETIFSPQSISLALKLAGFDGVEVGEVVPATTTIRSRIRLALWRLARLVPLAVDVIETGGPGARVFSRNMSIVGRRPEDGGE